MTTRTFSSIGVLFLLAGSFSVQGQSISVFSTDLQAPTDLVLSNRNNLLVAEAGSPETGGRISIIDEQGNRRTLIDGLPFGLAIPEGDPSGPSGLAMRGRTLYVTIGAGDATVNGPIPGSEVPNPSGPSSPIFSSVLAIHFNAHLEDSTDGFSLTLADQEALSRGERLRLDNGFGDKLTVWLVADFEDFVPNPFPGADQNVRSSNPFGVAIKGNQLFVVDASMNLVRAINLAKGMVRTLTTFASVPNPLPFGPPFIDPVPDSIRLFENTLLVTFLIGFPFPAGAAQVVQVDSSDGTQEVLIDGLSSAIDVLPVKIKGPAKNKNGKGNKKKEKDVFLVLEFSTDMLGGAPGRLLLFESPGDAPLVVADDLISPTSLERSSKTGEIFVSEIFTGRIIRIGP